MRSRYTFIILGILIISLVGLWGCSKKEIQYESIAYHEDLVENSEYGSIDMEFSFLNGEDIRSFEVTAGKEYEFQYEYLITEGEILLQFKDSDDNIIDEVTISSSEFEESKKGLEKENPNSDVNIINIGRSLIIRSNDDLMKIAVTGSNAKGHIKITW